MCEIDCEDPSDVWAQTWHTKAVCGKPRRCQTCGTQIRPGEAYLRTASLYDGHWSSALQCALCGHIQLRFGHEHGTQPFPTELWEYLESCVDDSMHPVRHGWSDTEKECRSGHQPWFIEAKAEGREWRTYIGWIKRRHRRAKRLASAI